MKKMILKFIKHPLLYRKLLKFFVWLDNFSYIWITKLAILGNDGMHPKHRILNYHKFFADNVSLEDSVVDIGCGNGANAFDIAKKAKEVVGVDIENASIKEAQKNYSLPNLSYIVADITTYDFGKRFDKIVLSNVLEHIEYRVEFLKKLHNVSDTILLRVPMIDREWVAIFKKEQGFEYRLDPTHFTEYTVKQIEEETKASGWKIESYSVQFGEFWGVIRSRK